MIQEELKVVWVGFHDEGRLALQSILERGYNVAAILTLNSVEAKKRSGVSNFSYLAEKYTVPIYEISHVNSLFAKKLLAEIKPDVLCVIGWGQILDSETLSFARKITMGAHASLLPKNRGSAPINWSIIRGESETGNTLMELNSGVDTGGIIAQRKFDISLFDSCRTLYGKVAESNASMLIEALASIVNSTLKVVPQTSNQVDILPRRKPSDGRINWQKTSKQLYDFVRALTVPYPGAFSFVDGVQVIIWEASWSPISISVGKGGEISGFRYGFENSQCAIEVVCGTGILSIHKVEIESEGLLWGEDLIERFKYIEKFDG